MASPFMIPRVPQIAAAMQPYRFLRAEGVPRRPGDVSRFTPEHVIAVSGDAVVGKWRPVDVTFEPTLTVDRECLSLGIVQQDTVGFANAASAIHTLVVGNFDVVVELCVQQRSGWPDDAACLYAAGVYVNVTAAGRGIGINCDTAETAGVPAVEYVQQFDMDATDGDFPFTPSGNEVLTTSRLQHHLFRVKRIADVLQVFASHNGITWQKVGVQSFASAVTPATLGVFGWSTMLPSASGLMRVMVSGVKFLDPAVAFQD